MRARSVLTLLCALVVMPAEAQELADRFRDARTRRVAVEMAAEHGLALAPKPLDHIPTRSDSLAAWMASKRPEVAQLAVISPPPEPFKVDSVRVVNRLERPVFLNRWGQTKWAFMQGRRHAEIDTTSTTDIRARMQARFGAPTMTLAEMDSVENRIAEEIVQFEYWMVLNDSIPVMVLDVDGPLGRGVVVATEARFREDLDAIRYGLLNPLFSEPRKAPYVDYFYNPVTGAWHATGYDGASFFHRRIGRPNLKLGRPALVQYVSPPVER